MRLILVGNVPVDLVMRVPALPGTGDDVQARSVDSRPGGGFHVLRAAWEAGLAGTYAGTHGAGPYGDLVRTALAGIGCQVVQPPLDDVDTGLVLVLVDAAGERTFVSSPEAVVPYTEEMLSRVQPSESDLVYVSGYSLGLGQPSASLAGWVAGLARDHLVFCDLGPGGAVAGPEVLQPVLGRLDWLSCNTREAAALTGLVDPVAACRELRRRTSVAGLLLRAGAAGCWLMMPDGDAELIAAPSTGPVEDTNGAGDTHSGCFLAALAAGNTPPEAVRLANSAAAASVSSGVR